MLVLEVGSKDLARLNHKISSAVPNTTTYPYNPHITVAYMAPGSAAPYVGMPHELEGLTVVIDRLTFSDQEGLRFVIPLDGGK